MEFLVHPLLDALLILPPLAWVARGWRRGNAWNWAAHGATVGLWVVASCGRFVTPVGFLMGVCGLAAVTVARRLGAPPGRTVMAAAVLVPALIAADATRFYVWELRPWLARVRAAQEAYPPVPRSALLPDPPPTDAPPHPGEPAWDGHFESESLASYEEAPGEERNRKRVLAVLHGVHDRYAYEFQSRFGFGAIRMAGFQRRPLEHLGEPAVVPAFPQPGDGRLTDDAGLTPIPDPAAALAEYHTARGIDFANEPGFGALNTAEHLWDLDDLPDDADPADAPFLIGFRPHAARSAAGDGPLMPGWKLHRIELIGLVTHDEPVAYASEDLPRMGEAATHDTRPLTAFEADALPALAAGAWVTAAADRYRLRALGALPAANACAECHGVPVGTLLGALSYDFYRTPAGLDGEGE